MKHVNAVTTKLTDEQNDKLTSLVKQRDTSVSKLLREVIIMWIDEQSTDDKHRNQSTDKRRNKWLEEQVYPRQDSPYASHNQTQRSLWHA